MTFRLPLLTRRTFQAAALALLAAALPLAAAETALDRYVKKPDSTYKYELLRRAAGNGYTTYTIDLTSQTGARRRRWIARFGNTG